MIDDTQISRLSSQLGMRFGRKFVVGIMKSLNIQLIDGVEYFEHCGYLIPLKQNFRKLVDDLVKTCKERLPENFDLKRVKYEAYSSFYTLDTASPIFLNGLINALLTVFDADYVRIRKDKKGKFNYDIYVLYNNDTSKTVHLTMSTIEKKGVIDYDKVVFKQVGVDSPTLTYLISSALKDNVKQSGYQSEFSTFDEDFVGMCHIIYDECDRYLYTRDGMIPIYDYKQRVLLYEEIS